MLKHLGITATVIGVSALAVGSVAPATSHGGDGKTIRVLSKFTEEAFVDVGKPGFSLGDSFVFTAKLTKHGKKVGRVGAVCTITSVRKEESQCVGTARFRNGQIAVQGLVAGEPEVFSFPITGGTGAFEGAEGTLVVREISDTRERLTFHLSD